MSINYTNLRLALYQIINTLTGKQTIWSNQNANTPEGDCLILNISSFRFVGGTDWQSKPNASDEAQTQGDRELILSIQCISENSMQILLDLIDKLNLSSGTDLLCSKKIAYVDMDGDIANITTYINKSFETRAAVDLVFRISKNYSAPTVDQVNHVSSVGINGELVENATEEPYPVEFVVNE